MTDVPVDNAARGAAPEGLTLAEEEELRAELAKVRGSSVWQRVPPLCSAGKEETGGTGAGLGVLLLGFVFLAFNFAVLPLGLSANC